MDETYRMLRREHEADLARAARNRQLAAAVRAAGQDHAHAPERAWPARRFRLVPA